MGFLKRLFSIGSKRSKKRSAADPCTDSVPQRHLQPPLLDDTEAAVGRLLRSSSARCAVIDPDSLPPLPHPIDSVVPPPKSSSTTLASVSARSTYSVTIHGRTVHSRTEFPNAYPPMDDTFTPKRSLIDSSPRRRSKSVPITPRDKNRLIALRQDPSVASLLNHYDEQGHLDSAIFSNTPSPQKEDRVQRRRTGSTLRQLLGNPSCPRTHIRNSSAEGDISWAEKFLGETDCNSSVSSMGPQTPVDTHFAHNRSTDVKTAIPIECDTSAANHPTFSSLEVELSVSTDPQAPDSPHANSMSPQRASQVFGFLGHKKRALDSPVSRLPQLKTTTPHYRRLSADSSISDTKCSHIPLPRRCSTDIPTNIPQPTSPTSQRCYSLASDRSRSPSPSPTAAMFLSAQEDEGSAELQPVIAQYTEQSSLSPRSPCFPSRIPSRQNTGRLSVPCKVDDSPVAGQPFFMQTILGERSNTDNKSISTAPRPRETHSQIPKLRSASGSSSSSAESKHDGALDSPRRHPLCLQPGIQIKPRATVAEFSTGVAPHGKENDALSRLPQPVTPVRPFGLHLREAPSPTSSSELSPVAKQMMTDLRQQRTLARQRERQAGRLGSGQSRIRY